MDCASQSAIGPDKPVAGQHYFIEAVHKQGQGGDHLAVGWQLPNGVFERPIPGARLSPWTDPATNQLQKTMAITLVSNAVGSATISLVARDTLGRTVTNQFLLTVLGTVPHFDSI